MEEILNLKSFHTDVNRRASPRYQFQLDIEIERRSKSVSRCHADGSPVTETIYTHVISEDGKRIAAQLGNAVWGVLDASWTEKENGSEGALSKPFIIN